MAQKFYCPDCKTVHAPNTQVGANFNIARNVARSAPQQAIRPLRFDFTGRGVYVDGNDVVWVLTRATDYFNAKPHGLVGDNGVREFGAMGSRIIWENEARIGTYDGVSHEPDIWTAADAPSAYGEGVLLRDADAGNLAIKIKAYGLTHRPGLRPLGSDPNPTSALSTGLPFIPMKVGANLGAIANAGIRRPTAIARAGLPKWIASPISDAYLNRAALGDVSPSLSANSYEDLVFKVKAYAATHQTKMGVWLRIFNNDHNLSNDPYAFYGNYEDGREVVWSIYTTDRSSISPSGHISLTGTYRS